MPAPPSLSEAEEAYAEGFLDDILLCLPILGYSLFESGTSVVGLESTAGSGELLLHLRAKGIEATGVDTAAGFVVRAGSRAVGKEKVAPSTHTNMVEIRDELMRQNVLVLDADGYRLTQDYIFASPSLAAGVFLGRPANGRIEWKTAEGRSLKDIQDTAATT
jgi:hypothetical protein